MLSDREFRALSLSAVLCEINGGNHKTLYMHDNTKYYRQLVKKTYKRDWGIQNRKDVQEQLHSLNEGGGHREAYRSYHDFLLKLPAENIPAYIGRFAGNEEQYNNLQIIANYRFDLRRCGITGWDACRYVSICRNAAHVGYISDKEAWEWILALYDEIQDGFDSWEQYCLSYVVGRLYWRSDLSESTVNEMNGILRKLLYDKDALLNDLPFTGE